jgi:ribosomal-protein-alanine N-acetyltransferase
VRALLEVRPLNVSAVTLYRAMGFVELSRRARYYDDGEDALVMELRLA